MKIKDAADAQASRAERNVWLIRLVDWVRRGEPVSGTQAVLRLMGRDPQRQARLQQWFSAFWRDNDVRSFGEGTKHLHHPVAGVIAMEYSSFTVDGRTDLGMVVYNPATQDDVDKVRRLMAC